MFRTRRLTCDDVFQPLGELALGLVGVGFMLGLAALVVLGLVLCGAATTFDWLHKQRMLAPIVLGLLLGAVVIHLTGCTAPSQLPRDPRDPMIWRPTAPAHYPLPR